MRHEANMRGTGTYETGTNETGMYETGKHEYHPRDVVKSGSGGLHQSCLRIRHETGMFGTGVYETGMHGPGTHGTGTYETGAIAGVVEHTRTSLDEAKGKSTAHSGSQQTSCTHDTIHSRKHILE